MDRISGSVFCEQSGCINRFFMSKYIYKKLFHKYVHSTLPVATGKALLKRTAFAGRGRHLIAALSDTESPRLRAEEFYLKVFALAGERGLFGWCLLIAVSRNPIDAEALVGPSSLQQSCALNICQYLLQRLVVFPRELLLEGRDERLGLRHAAPAPPQRTAQHLRASAAPACAGSAEGR